MADTPQTGETVTQGDSQTTVQTPVTPAPTSQSNASDPAEVERLRKENEQRDIRIRQLENEKIARDKAEEDARQKQLEEDQKFKELYESEKQQREALVKEREDAQRTTELQTAQNEILSKFPDNVRKVAETAGLTLTDDTEEGKAALTTRLETIAKEVGTPPKVAGNNAAPTGNAPTPERETLLKGMKFGDPASTRAAIGTLSAIKEMKKANGIAEEI